MTHVDAFVYALVTFLLVVIIQLVGKDWYDYYKRRHTWRGSNFPKILYSSTGLAVSFALCYELFKLILGV